MDHEILLNKLLYVEEHLSCRNYLGQVEAGFKYIELEQELFIRKECACWNYLLLFLDGKFVISQDQFSKRKFNAGTMVLLPKMSAFSGWGSSGGKLVALSFDTPPGSCDMFVLQSLSSICETIKYDFQATEIRYPVTPYLEVLTFCLKNGMSCGHLHELMAKELFFLIRGFYTKEEIATLFYPIIGQDFHFKQMIIENYQKVDSVEALIDVSNMGRSSFFTKFKNVFGITAKQWIVKQRDRKILDEVMRPNVTVKELMVKFMFDSQTQFTQYCKLHFGYTPKQLIERYRVEKQ